MVFYCLNSPLTQCREYTSVQLLEIIVLNTFPTMDERTIIKNFLKTFVKAGGIKLEETADSLQVVFPTAKPTKSLDKGFSPSFDLEALYKLYPLKKGKAKGMSKLAKLIKSEEDYENIKRCILVYAESVRNSDPRYIQHFSTFMNGSWQDYLEPENKIDLSNDDYYLLLKGVGLHLQFEGLLSRIKEAFPCYEDFRTYLAERKEFVTVRAQDPSPNFIANLLAKAIKERIGV